MTDRTPPSDRLGPPPLPDDDRRERAIANALDHFDDLTVDVVLTHGADPPALVEADVGDELSNRRRARGPRRNGPQRWLAAAAVLLVLGIGGALVAQLVAGSDEQMTGQMSDQAEGGTAEATGTDRGVADRAEASQAGADASKSDEPAEAAPEAAAPPLPRLPEWVCELSARLGFDVCAR